MTVTYTSEVTKSTWFGCFLKLLLRWRGSIYKLLWLDIIVYLGLYFTINFIYRFGLDDASQKSFENWVRYCSKYANLIPLSFVLGFYVSLIMGRWWQQYCAIPYPDTIALLVGALVIEKGEQTRLIKRTILRYVCLSFTMTLTMISPKVKRRFPELENLVEAGLLLKEEKKIMDELNDEKYPSYQQYWLPLAWASNLIMKAKSDQFIQSDAGVRTLLLELNKFRTKCGTLLDYDWISVPLVYTQVVTLAVYSYFLTTLMSRQTLQSHDDDVVDLIFPIFTILEYFFYVGWLKVAESLINPFGEDDDDFEVVWLVDRNLQMSYIIVDKIHQKLPPLQKDQYWNTPVLTTLPFTNSTEKYMAEHPISSTMNIIIKKDKRKRLFRRHTQTSFQRHKNNDVEVGGDIELREESSRLLHRHSEPVLQNLPIFEEPVFSMDKFNELKEQRMMQKKEKLLLYLELTRMNNKGNKTEEELIIERILYGANANNNNDNNDKNKEHDKSKDGAKNKNNDREKSNGFDKDNDSYNSFDRKKSL